MPPRITQSQEARLASAQHYEQLNPKERKRRELQDLVKGSDTNRLAIASGAIEQQAKQYGGGSQGVFWALHANHFPVSPFRTINADSKAAEYGDNVSYYLKKPMRAQAESQIGALRTAEVSVGFFDNVDSAFLPDIAQAFFESIDDILLREHPENWTTEEKRIFLSRVEVVQVLCHFPFEASGRTIEDFLVYLAKKLGIHLTFSESGFRGFLGSPLIKESRPAWQQMQGTADSEALRANSVGQYDQEMGRIALDLSRTLQPQVQTPLWSAFWTSTQAFADVLEKAEQYEYFPNPHPLFVHLMTEWLFEMKKFGSEKQEEYSIRLAYQNLPDIARLLATVESRLTLRLTMAADPEQYRRAMKFHELFTDKLLTDAHEVAFTLRELHSHDSKIALTQMEQSLSRWLPPDKLQQI